MTVRKKMKLRRPLTIKPNTNNSMLTSDLFFLTGPKLKTIIKRIRGKTDQAKQNSLQNHNKSYIPSPTSSTTNNNLTIQFQSTNPISSTTTRLEVKKTTINMISVYLCVLKHKRFNITDLCEKSNFSFIYEDKVRITTIMLCSFFHSINETQET